MKKIPILLLILISICFSCSEQELGDGYYYLPKYEALDIGYPNEEAIVYKSSQEYAFSDIKIRGDVIEIKFNSRAIIANRDPLVRNNNTGVNEYFIILKNNDSVIGPLNRENFDKTKNNLGINLEF